MSNKSTIIFIVLLMATSIMFNVHDAQYGTVDFFQKHGIFFLIFITIFPRLTLLFSSVASGGFLWWLGFIFCPRILVAILATLAYGKTNTLLVVASWLVALSGEFFEKKKLAGNRRFVFRTYNMGGGNPFPGYGQTGEPPRPEKVSISKDDVIEAEFTKKS